MRTFNERIRYPRDYGLHENELSSIAKKNTAVELERTKTQLTKCMQEISQLKSENQQLREGCQRVISENEILKQKASENENLKLSIENLKKKSTEEINSLKMQITEISKQLQQKNAEISRVTEDYKKHLIDVHLKGMEKLFKKELEAVKDIYELNEDLGKEGEKDEEIHNQEVLFDPGVDFEAEDYIRSEKCFCGKPKRYGAKQCDECSKIFDRIRNRHKCTMEEARKKYIESLEKR